MTGPADNSEFGVDRQTGLATVQEFMSLERQVDARCRSSGEAYGIVLVDIEGLRGINTAHGFDFGDHVLLHTAQRLRHAFAERPPLCIARVGGDEFAVLFERIDAAMSLSQLARKIRLDVAGQPLLIDNERLRVHVRTTFRRGPSHKPVASDLLWEVEWADRIEATRELHQRLEFLELRDGQRGGQAGDLRDRLAAAEERAVLALYDPLTGARNRRGLAEVITGLRGPRVVAFVDIDNLRDLNGLDDQNWDAGDQALLGVAALLRTLPEGAIVVRWGGDEFLVILPDVSVSTVVEALEALMQRARQELRVGDVAVTFSAGVSACSGPDDQDAAEERARKAAREAKSSGRACVVVARVASEPSHPPSRDRRGGRSVMVGSSVYDLQRLRPDHDAAILDFERANRAYFAQSISDRGDEFFEHFADRHRAMLAEQEAGRGAFYVLVDDDGGVVGRFNLYEVADETANVGYRVAERVTGRGVATSGLRALCRIAADDHHLRMLKAATSNENVASQRVLFNAGFVITGPTEIAGRPGVLYELVLARP